jgi:hypothetical protein
MSATHEELAEIDRRIDAGVQRAISNVKIWLLTSLIVYIFSGFLGIATMLFYVGQMKSQFDYLVESQESQIRTDDVIVAWMARKDALLDDLIEHMRENDGYVPPAWYREFESINGDNNEQG